MFIKIKATKIISDIAHIDLITKFKDTYFNAEKIISIEPLIIDTELYAVIRMDKNLLYLTSNAPEEIYKMLS